MGGIRLIMAQGRFFFKQWFYFKGPGEYRCDARKHENGCASLLNGGRRLRSLLCFIGIAALIRDGPLAAHDNFFE